MSCVSKLLCAAAVVAAMAVGAASASASWTIDPAGRVTLETSSPAVIDLSLSDTSEDWEMLECDWRLTAEIDTSAFLPLPGTPIGTVTDASVSNCNPNSAWVTRFIFPPYTRGSNATPWTLTYAGSLGTAPTSLTAVDLWLEGMEFNTRHPRSGFSDCEWVGRLGLRADLSHSSGTSNPWRFTNVSLTIVAAEMWDQIGFCESSWTLGPSGEGSRGSFAFGHDFEWDVAAAVEIYPDTVDFGRVSANGLAKRIVEFAVGEASTVTSIAPRAGAHFAVTDPNGCRGRAMADGATCRFTVIFAPATTGSLNDEIVVTTDRGSEGLAVSGRS